MTPQEIFNKAYIGVIKQGRAARRPGDGMGCFYYEPETQCMCAVGHVLGEELAKQWSKAQVTTVINASWNENATKPDWVKPNLTMLERMQNAHDNSPTGEEFLGSYRQRMEKIAKDYGLTIPEIPA